QSGYRAAPSARSRQAARMREGGRLCVAATFSAASCIGIGEAEGQALAREVRVVHGIVGESRAPLLPETRLVRTFLHAGGRLVVITAAGGLVMIKLGEGRDDVQE